MRIVWFSVFLCFISCNERIANEDFIKWNFYKKNIHSNFLINNEEISFVRADLDVKRLGVEYSEPNCYQAIFRIDTITSNMGDYLQMINPITHTICLSDDNEKLASFIFGGDVKVSKINMEIERKEDLKLQEIVSNGNVSEFLKTYNFK